LDLKLCDLPVKLLSRLFEEIGQPALCLNWTRRLVSECSLINYRWGRTRQTTSVKICCKAYLGG